MWIVFWGLFLVHQDLWFWNDGTLIFGFLPVGLAYHALYSVLAGVFWVLAIRFAWPTAVEQWAQQVDTEASATKVT